MNYLHTDLTEINKKISSINDQLLHLPEGNLQCERNGKYAKYYHLHNGKRQIIPAKKLSYAKNLALKQYLSYQLEDLEFIRSHMSKYETSCSRHKFKADSFLQKPHISELILSSIYSNGSSSTHFSSPISSYTSSHQENLKFRSISGNLLRSKSEMLIDQALFQNNLLYRYEYPLELNGIIYHPDFSIIRNSTNEMVIWEHFGMIDNSTYANNALNKLSNYISNGFIPNINLITTYETLEHPLDNRQIDNALRILLS